MLSAFATSEEGQKHVAKVRQLFDFSVFLLESISLPAVMQPAPDMEVSPMCFLVLQVLLFIRNATIDQRQSKVYFLKNEDFIPQLLAFMSHSGVHPRLRAYAAAVLWSLVHGHQGVKAAINKPAVLQELQAMHQEFSAKASVNSASEALGFDLTLNEESLRTE